MGATVRKGKVFGTDVDTDAALAAACRAGTPASCEGVDRVATRAALLVAVAGSLANASASTAAGNRRERDLLLGLCRPLRADLRLLMQAGRGRADPTCAWLPGGAVLAACMQHAVAARQSRRAKPARDALAAAAWRRAAHAAYLVLWLRARRAAPPLRGVTRLMQLVAAVGRGEAALLEAKGAPGSLCLGGEADLAALAEPIEVRHGGGTVPAALLLYAEGLAHVLAEAPWRAGDRIAIEAPAGVAARTAKVMLTLQRECIVRLEPPARA